MKVKNLLLAVTAVLAMSAVIASAAQAATGTITAGVAAGENATVTGTQINENVFSNGIRSVTCTTASLTSTIPKETAVATVAPAYSNCTGNGGTTATVRTNGCTYTLSADKPTGSGTETTGTWYVAIDCAAGAAIEIDIWATGVPHSQTKLCILRVPPQGPIAAGVYHTRENLSTKKHDLELTTTIPHPTTGLTVERVYGGAVACGPAHQPKGTYKGNITVTAVDKLGAPVNLTVS